MQSSLLTQVKEMDNVVDATRGEVRTLSQDCTVLRKEVIRAREELTKEQQRRLNAEKKTKQISDKLGTMYLFIVCFICLLFVLFVYCLFL